MIKDISHSESLDANKYLKEIKILVVLGDSERIAKLCSSSFLVRSVLARLVPSKRWAYFLEFFIFFLIYIIMNFPLKFNNTLKFKIIFWITLLTGKSMFYFTTQFCCILIACHLYKYIYWNNFEICCINYLNCFI